MTAAEFKAGIRDAIETDLTAQADADFTLHIDTLSAGSLRIDGHVDLDALTDAVHEFVVEALSPPF